MTSRLSELEQLVMDYIWSHPQATADDCREALARGGRVLKDSTVRTLLARLLRKDYVRFQTEGRTHRYLANQRRQSVAAAAVRQIVDRFCGGSVEELIAGMVDGEMVDPRELESMARRIARRRAERAG
jgi:BlaI family transcriptional regulator, penicillinase repressor